MSCCSNDKSEIGIEGSCADDSAQVCRTCEKHGRIVPRKTMFLMLTSDRLGLVADAQYSFCLNPDCPIVYFAHDGSSIFTTKDLRVRVGLKERENPIPLCYCFGFDEMDIRRELAETGKITISKRIALFIRQGLCACLERNPSGSCCLGEINKVVKRLVEGEHN